MSARIEALGRAFATPVSGPTYRPATRLLAAGLVVGLIVWGGRLLLGGDEPLDATRIGAAIAIVAALLWPMPSMLFGCTVIDATGVRQLGWMGRDTEWTQVQRIRFVRVPLAPRLIVSAGFGRVKVFYSGSADLDAAFAHATRLLSAPMEDVQ